MGNSSSNETVSIDSNGNPAEQENGLVPYTNKVTYDTESHEGPLTYYMCPILQGYPPFNQILKFGDGWTLTLMLMNIFMVALILVIFIQEGMYMKTYFKQRKKFDRHQRKMVFLQASVPFALAFSALIVNIAPRVHMIVTAFASTYFAFCINGFARMIFDYFGGMRKCAECLIRDGVDKISYRAAPLTCCCICLPTPYPSVKSLKIMRMGVLQIVPISLIVTFLTPAIILDGSVCVNGKMPVNGLNSSPFIIITIIDLLSTMTAVTALTALAKNTKEHLTQYKVSQKFAVFKLALIFFRVQPSIMNAMASLIGKLKPIRPWYSNEAYTMTFNAQLQIIEFFIISIILRFIYERTLQEQNASRQRASRNWRQIAFLSHNQSDSEDEPEQQQIIGSPKSASSGGFFGVVQEATGSASAGGK